MAGFLKPATNDRGNAIIQFAIMLIPFIALVITIIEIFISLTAQTSLDAQTAAAARRLSAGGMTGMNADATADEIRTIICDNGYLPLIGPATCNTTLQVGILPVSAVTSIPPAVANGAINGAAFTRTISPDGIMLVRTAIQVPRLFSMFGAGNIMSGNRVLISGFITRIDPYAEYNINGVSAQPNF